MPISDEFQLLFVHIPKNAGTSIEKALNARQTGHMSWRDYREHHSREWDAYTSFAVLRDPVERFISCYNYARMERSYWHSSIPGERSIYGMHPDYEVCKSRTINEVASLLVNDRSSLQHQGWTPQNHWINDNGKTAVDCLIILSQLDEAMHELAPGISIGRINASTSTCEATLDDRSTSMVSEIYKEDVKLINLLQGCEKGLLWSDTNNPKRSSSIFSLQASNNPEATGLDG